MIELNFIKDGIQREEMNRFITKELGEGQISQCVIKKTPLYTHILIYTQRPSRVVGFKGSKLMQLKETINEKFKIKNLKMDVYGIDNPYLDASLMANFIARSLEQGKKHKRVVSFIIDKIMSSGAIGVEINVTGKISGSRSRGDKFYRGYLKKCGDPAKTCVEKKKVLAVLKQGAIGIKVIIMKVMPDVMQLERNINVLETQLKKEMAEHEKKCKAEEDAKSKEATKPEAQVKEKEEETKEKPEAPVKEEEKKEPAKTTETKEEVKSEKQEVPKEKAKKEEKEEDTGVKKAEDKKETTKKDI
ncbi:MAG: 30S ribosomal protein S3 [Candidatus Aenigmarchaeota archaeon]|nr:30S ribosomal protein S3 [Candidatus Aenigmarchaeota archaeon]